MRTRIFVAAVGLFAASALAAQTPPTAPAPAPAPAEKRICRTEAPTGSLIASRKRCYTKAEWDNLAAGARAVTERFTDDNRSRPGSN